MFFLVLGDFWWFFSASWLFLAFLGGFEGSWLFLVVQMVNLWFYVVFGVSWWFLVAFGGSWQFLVVL